jgi:methanogenic corrinoid protein MtbC1
MAAAHAGHLPPSLRDASTSPRYNTAAVVRLSGVPAATFRAWERRYGFPAPRRMPAGQRLYSERDVDAIRWLHSQTESGLTISRAVALIRELLEEAQELGTPAATGRPLADLAHGLEQALLSADGRTADALLGEAFGLYSVEDVALRMMQPVLVEVGERWQQGDLTVADEHYITQYLLRKALGLFSAYDRPHGQQIVLACCAPGELHEIGLLLVSVFLLRRSYRVVYLGPNLPVEDLATAVARLQPDLVCLSATMPEAAQRLVDEIGPLLASGRLQAPLGFGGQAFNQDLELTARLPGLYLGPDASAAVSTVESLLSPARA